MGTDPGSVDLHSSDDLVIFFDIPVFTLSFVLLGTEQPSAAKCLMCSASSLVRGAYCLLSSAHYLLSPV